MGHLMALLKKKICFESCLIDALTRLEKEAVILFPTLSNLPGLSLGWKAHFPPGVGDKQASQKARQRVRSSQPHQH